MENVTNSVAKTDKGRIVSQTGPSISAVDSRDGTYAKSRYNALPRIIATGRVQSLRNCFIFSIR